MKQAKHNTTVIKIGDCDITPCPTARNIGAVFDSEMSMVSHVNYICRIAYYHLRNIASIRSCLTQKDVVRVMYSFVISSINYANCLLHGIPDCLINKLQRVQNAAARLVVRCHRWSHIPPVLKKLPWLPVKQRIHYAILLLTFRAQHGLAPAYITDLLHEQRATGVLRSATNNDMYVPPSRSRYVLAAVEPLGVDAVVLRVATNHLETICNDNCRLDQTLNQHREADMLAADLNRTHGERRPRQVPRLLGHLDPIDTGRTQQQRGPTGTMNYLVQTTQLDQDDLEDYVFSSVAGVPIALPPGLLRSTCTTSATLPVLDIRRGPSFCHIVDQCHSASPRHQTRTQRQTPHLRPMPHSPVVHGPICASVSSSEDVFLEHFLTEHRDLCREAETDDADGGHSLSSLQSLEPVETVVTDMTDTRVTSAILMPHVVIINDRCRTSTLQ
ncbi:hypothetical protein LSAT2_021832 [Lamellibrachia satsuma]|nr:hypothetical protein LSAT2_021832 [Lamellibrachia satsuma]